MDRKNAAGADEDGGGGEINVSGMISLRNKEKRKSVRQRSLNKVLKLSCKILYVRKKVYFCSPIININMKIEASIVSVGSWNSRIFTPAWVSANVFAMPDGESMNIALNEQQMTLSYEWKNIQLQLSDTRIEFKCNQCRKETLALMEQCYQHLSELLPYTPVTAVGYNLNITLTLDEFKKTVVSESLVQSNIDIYINGTQTFSAVKDGAVRSFVVQQNTDNAEIRANFHYPQPKLIPAVGTAFGVIESEMKHFLGYEFSF